MPTPDGRQGRGLDVGGCTTKISPTFCKNHDKNGKKQKKMANQLDRMWFGHYIIGLNFFWKLMSWAGE